MHKNWGKTIRYIFHLCASFSPRDTLKECIFTQKTPEIHLKQKEDTPKYVSQYLSLHTRKVSVFHSVWKSTKSIFPPKIQIHLILKKKTNSWLWNQNCKQTADICIRNVNKQLKVNVARFARNVVLNETFLVTFKHCVFSSVFEDHWLKRQNSKELVF